MSSVDTSSPLLVPIQIDAFRLNEAVCGDGSDADHSARIAPINQPNYTFLRLDDYVIQNDILQHTDLHNSAPASRNSRLRDLGSLPTTQRRHRQGIYLHWTLPRCYRSGATVVDGATGNGSKGNAGNQPVSSNTPGFIQPPTRWLLIRKLDVDSIRPREAQSAFQEYAAWVIESDFLWKTLDEIPLDYDLQVDASPFVTGGDDTVDTTTIREQAEVFIGRKFALQDWKGESSDSRPDISLIRSSNQLFADYQPHNSNVFSTMDNFQYGDDPKALQYLDQAKASYYLLGWHRKSDVDPLWDNTKSVARQTRMAGLFMNFPGQVPTEGKPVPVPSKEEQDYLDSQDAARLLCHGAMYDVVWDVSTKPGTVPANDFARRLREPTVPAMSVGTTPIDALITYCTARKSAVPNDPLVHELEEDILAIESLLHTRDDGVEGQREAKDTIYNWNFERSPGGVRYNLAGEDNDGKPTDVSPESAKAITEINQMQILCDACSRVLQQYRWEMFSLWWKYVNDARNKKSDTNNNNDHRDKVVKLAGRISALETVIDSQRKAIDKKLHPDATSLPGVAGSSFTPIENLLQNAKTGTLPFFYRGRDPTVLVGGIDSGWPLDYLDNVLVRLPTETIASPDAPEALKELINPLLDLLLIGPNPVSQSFNLAITALITEFWALRPEGGSVGPAPAGKYYPQFHDQKTADSPPMPNPSGDRSAASPPSPLGANAPTPSALNDDRTPTDFLRRWRDRWSDRQPWFPLFAEWEVEYTHIPSEYWALKEQAARLSDNPLIRYGIDVTSEKPLYDELKNKLDSYVLSGRVLVLPQPSFSLGAKVRQLFTDTPPSILDNYLNEGERTKLLENINALSYLSAPLSGLTDGLLTMAQGTHIKPENKVLTPTGEPKTTPINAAVFLDAGLTSDNLGKIQNNSALTPFAAVTHFDNATNCPFKPVTHGQFRFRKFNIIDKFGQAIVANDPKPTSNGPPPIYPAISDWYEPQMVANSNTAQTVIKDEDGKCEFMQMPPQINQNARLNANFVWQTARDASSPQIPNLAQWRPVSDWENPIWGWLLVNYADYGIQLFLPDGTFYREVRIGGRDGALVSPKWTPFAPDPDLIGADTIQMDALIKRLSEKTYLESFWSMLVKAMDALPPAPTTYAGFLNSIVGKPLALANIGWSLELDGPPQQNQSTDSAVISPDLNLLPDDHKKPFDPDNKSYVFPMKLGDKERNYDGLVGYCNLEEDLGGINLDLSKIYTYFTEQDSAPLVKITGQNCPNFKPFWIEPFKENADTPPISEIDPVYYDNARNLAMQASGHVLGVILDPFTAVHAYSSILPAAALRLSPWTWQGAMDKMTAFLHAGPFHSTVDVDPYKEERRLKTENMKDIPPSVIPIPALPAGDWNWLQPYRDAPDLSDEDPPAYNSFGLDRRGNLASPGFQKGPYTAIEGYLQLRNPIMQDPPKSDPPKPT